MYLRLSFKVIDKIRHKLSRIRNNDLHSLTFLIGSDLFRVIKAYTVPQLWDHNGATKATIVGINVVDLYLLKQK